MVKEKRRKKSRIPVQFADEESAPASALDGETQEGEEAPDSAGDTGELTPEEIGRASSYEGETEVQRRIDRGAESSDPEGQDRADESDTAGAPRRSQLPENREDQDTRVSFDGEDDAESANTMSGAGRTGQLVAQLNRADPASGPLLAELVATRAELKRVQTALEKAEAERHDLLDRLARRQADFENYRKRVERDRSDTYHRIVGEVVSHLLPVIDNLRRALDAETSVQSSESEEFRHFLHGIELIYKQLSDVLESLGVEPVATVGQAFDPHVHEAIATEQTDEYEPDTVMAEIVRGYRLGETLLRPAMVKVAK